MKILIVEDVRPKASAIAEAVRAAGIDDSDIQVVPDIGNAKTVMTVDGPFDLLVLDMRIPRRFDGVPSSTGGLSLLQWADRKEVKIRCVIALSAYDPSAEDVRDLAIYGVVFIDYRPAVAAWRDFLTAFVRRMFRYHSNVEIQGGNVEDSKFGLPNLARFGEDLKRVGEGTDLMPIAHAFVDLDNFKVLNKELTHDKADIVVAEVAEAMRRTIGARASLYHRSGDEFLVLLENYTAEEARLLMQRCCRAIAEQSFGGLARGAVTVSVGVACLPDHAETAEGLRIAATRANQAAKDGGKNRVHVVGDV